MFLEHDGVKLYCDIQGRGQPRVLFVHGWTMSHEVWREQRFILSPKGASVAVDLRGFGRSDKPQSDYSLQEFASDLEFVVATLGLDKPVVVGWSLGASISLLYAATNPGSLSKLVLVDGSPMMMATPDFPHTISRELAEQILSGLTDDYVKGTRDFVEAMFPEAVGEDIKTWIHSIMQQTTVEIALRTIANAGEVDLRPRLDEITVPTLILCGKQDRVCLPGASRYMHERIANSQLHEFAGKGHAPFLTAADAFNDILRGFVA